MGGTEESWRVRARERYRSRVRFFVTNFVSPIYSLPALAMVSDQFQSPKKSIPHLSL